ncbi:hypothetical protein TTV14_gp1 [Torque teno virus 14]|uniref:Hepatitis TT virus Orf2/Gyrovirus Vp2 N-terminal domain-containing protein n=1 Tax=Torque teno virus 14 TaxID=687353 RepID=Q9DUH9_9VIRU|nr:hypothetical protein TTV14_gp1 [Torque teno virus 14]BAB18901.1 unnamed protein product [Torque teno virus 14]
MSFWFPPVHNVAGQERNWFESCFRSHAAFCGCGNFIGHLNNLADRYNHPGGPRPPGGPGPQAPVPTVRALPALPAAPSRPLPPPPPPCRGAGGEGGGADRDAGGAGDAGAVAGRGGDYGPEELEQPFAAVAGDE